MRAPDRATRAFAAVAVAIAVAAFLAYAIVAVGLGDFDSAAGVFLALGHDTAGGHLYRPLISEMGYGGTRYFPLFFALIAGFLRAGAGILTAGWLASAVSAVVLMAGMYRLVRRLDGAKWMAVLFAAASVAPYFVQQTLVEIRADVLAAALNLWGLAFVLPAWRVDSTSDEYTRPWRAALAFTLALAVKVTSLAVPLVIIVAALAARRRHLATALAWRLVVGIGVFFGLVVWLSGGLALESWRAVMSAGAGPAEMLRSVLAGDFLVLSGYSRLLLALLVITSLAILAAVWWATRHAIRPDASRSLLVPTALFVGASVTAVVLLSSPGTVAQNHVIEWIEIALVVLALIACTQKALTRTLVITVAALTVWASAQDFRHAYVLWQMRPDAATKAEIQRLIDDVAAAPGPVLSESSVWPLVAGRSAYSIDAFALRVVMQRRPDIERDLINKINAQAFSFVILKVDPASAEGRGYYTHQNFNWPSISRLLERYRLVSHPREDVFVYAPRRD